MKTVVITGGSRGIGAACAEKFIKMGYNTVVNYNLNKEKAEKIVSGKPNAVAVQADVSTEAGAKLLIETAVKKFGTVDVLVNNAGIALRKMLCDTNADDWKKLFATDCDAAFFCSKFASEYMVRQKSGRIINISSMWGIKGGSCEVAYSAAKASVIGFTKAFARELGPSNITVNCIAPGVIDTDMNGDLDEETKKSLADETPLCRLGKPEDVAAAVFFLASDEASFITAQVLGVDGGII